MFAVCFFYCLLLFYALSLLKLCGYNIHTLARGGVYVWKGKKSQVTVIVIAAPSHASRWPPSLTNVPELFSYFFSFIYIFFPFFVALCFMFFCCLSRELA